MPRNSRMPAGMREKLELAAELVKMPGMLPNGMKTKEAVFIALQYGDELGLAPMVAVQNIAVIQGKPAPGVHVMHGVARASGLTPPALSRALTSPDTRPSTVRALCRVLGLRVALVPVEPEK